MRKIVVSKTGGPGQLVLEDGADLKPGPGHIKVRVEAAGINYVDVHHRRGDFPVPTPFSPGMEGVGFVTELGAGVGGYKLGDRVAWIDVLGSYAESVLVPAERAIPVPKDFDIEQCLLLQGMTAEFLIEEYRMIGAGDIALVHAAAGGVGQILVQWLKHLEAFVIATASSKEKLETARKLGADILVNYRTESLVDAVKSATKGHGVDIAFDGVGKDTLAGTVASLATFGTAVSFGGSSGPAPAVDPQSLIPKAARLATGALFVYVAAPKELRRRSALVLEALEEGWIRTGSGRRYPLAEAALAHQDLESRRTEGKLFLVP